jgi:twinkle protein
MNKIPRQFDFTNQDLQDVFAEVEQNSLRRPSEFRDKVLSRIENLGHIEGLRLPWSRSTEKIRLRSSEISIWAGINGHRKSTLLNQVALWASREVTVGIASFEMPVDGLVHLMCQQGSGSDQPSGGWANQFLAWLDERMWFYDKLGSVPPLEVLGGIHAMAKQGCKLVVVDSLSMCRVSDDMERERLFMSELVSLAKALDIHVALVHHVRKPSSGGDDYVPSRFDVKGNGAIVDLAQNLFIVWADKKRANLERIQQAGGKLDAKDLEYLSASCDQKLIVAKQRHGEFEGAFRLWSHKSRQFSESQNRRTEHVTDFSRESAA